MLPVVSVFSRPELTKFGAAGSKSSDKDQSKLL